MRPVSGSDAAGDWAAMTPVGMENVVMKKPWTFQKRLCMCVRDT